jgi:hypothetical protein
MVVPERASKRERRPRSAVTSGRTLLLGADANSAWSRRYADLLVGHVSDCGGRGAVSEAKLSLIRRASALECQIELLEAKLSRGERTPLGGPQATFAGYLKPSASSASSAM